MAQNTTDTYRKFRYYEGVCSSGDFLKELAKVVSLGVKSEAKYDANGKVIPGNESKPITDLNWDIVYPLVDDTFDPGKDYIKLNDRDSYLNKEIGVSQLIPSKRIEKLENQIAQITNKVILRTTTTPKNAAELNQEDDLSVSGESDMASTTMYVEFYKPTYIANPEEYPLDAELHGITPQLITKQMYKDARKTTASVIYDLAQLVTYPDLDDYSNVRDHRHDGLITKKDSFEFVDCESEAYSTADGVLFGEEGIFQGFTDIFNQHDLNDIIRKPSESDRVKTITLNKTHLNMIKQTNLTLYRFLFNICNRKTQFTESDYDLIDSMILKVTLVGNESQHHYVTLSFKKKVEIYEVKLGTDSDPSILFLEGEYGHNALENVRPELYAEGRYTPLPKKYLGELDSTKVEFSSENQVKFCLDKVTRDDVLYGTIVLRYDYDKELNYVDLSSLEITDSVTLENNHYCLVRMFDNPNSDFTGPEPNIYDDRGNITSTNSHASPWSKLSWYQDFEEIMMDHIDEDVSVTSVTDGTLLVPLETAGLTADTRISYWINTNNDRFTLVVMGNPALDYERDRHLISSCYVGAIESFENSINDVSGNFALYTSSSTVPCKTSMEAYDTEYHINRDFDNSNFVENATAMHDIDSEYETKYPKATDREGNIQSYIDYVDKISGRMDYLKNPTDGFEAYYLTLTGNKFFIRNEVAWYMAIDNNDNPIPLNGLSGSGAIYYSQVAHQIPIYTTSDSRSCTMEFLLPELPSETKYVLFNFGYYEEKFIITSGITRDVFGNVNSIETIDDYGKNTSDGTLSVSMYHTRSKAFYQKHHFLFATTEEYMSKVMYGKSSYTGEYYADRIKITHGNDGPRGILSDTLVIDSSSLYPKDELVINKDFSKKPEDLEETFAYFPVTAPYSPIADGPNAKYGIALKKSERENYDAYGNSKLINIALSELSIKMNNYSIIDDDISLPSETENGCKIYWTVLDREDKTNSESPLANWIQDSNGEPITLNFANGTTSNVIGTRQEAHNIDIVWEGFTKGTNTTTYANQVQVDATKTATKTVNFKSKINIAPKTAFAPGSGVNKVLYGYSDGALSNITADTVLTKIFDDSTDLQDNIHEYAFKEMYTDLKHEIDLTDIENNGSITDFDQYLYNAHPDKYLNIFFTSDGSLVGEDNSKDTNNECHNRTITNYISIPLHYADSLNDNDQYVAGKAYYDLLQYPCAITVYTSGVTDANNQGILDNSTLKSRLEIHYQEYDTPLNISVQNMSGDVTISQSHYTSVRTTNVTNNTVSLLRSDILDDLYVNISK